MFIIDENTKEIIKDPDLDLGDIYDNEIEIYYRYILEKPAEYKEVVIAEYPETGGKDITHELVTPEVGHWEMIDTEGNILPYPIEIDIKGLLKEELTPDILQVGIYHKFTDEELKIREEERIKAEKEAKELAEKQKIMDELPNRVEAIEYGVDDSYDAIAELGVEVADHSISIDDIMDALVELGQLLEDNNG